MAAAAPPQDPLPCLPTPVKDWLYTIGVGFLVVSYWRSTWTLLDIWTCDQPGTASLAGGDSLCFLLPAAEDHPDGHYSTVRYRSANLTYGIGMALLFFGVVLMWSGIWLPRLLATPDGTALPGEVTPSLAVSRLLVVYILGAAAVCTWRGIWYWADHWVLPYNPEASYWTTSLVGSTVCFAAMAGASILAPPAIFLLDGPGENPPPVAVTILSSWHAVSLPAGEKPPAFPFYVRLLDLVGSFVALPFMVVWFWRGTWYIYDLYFWGMTPDRHDVHVSLGWGTLMFVLCFAVTCEPAIAFLEEKIPALYSHPLLEGLLGRLRTWVLAWGTVSFWRVVWDVWDEFLGGTTALSAGLGHALSVAALALFGCVSSIVAPASTMGVDAIPHPECADEPLFSMIPVPYDVLALGAIARQPPEPEEEPTPLKDQDATPKPASAAAAALADSRRSSEKEGGGEIEVPEKGVGQEAPLEPGEKEEGEKVEAGEAEAEALAPAPRPHPRSSIRLSIYRTFRRSGLLQSMRAMSTEGHITSYHELQRPRLPSRSRSEYAMRPSELNKRSRSRLFRSR